jgi:hypothetical protein
MTAGEEMVKKMVAYCGLVCTDCGAYIATQQNDDKLRQKVADDWTKKYNHPFKAADINCVGCLPVTGKHVGHCGMCEIRKCGQEKDVVNCAWCAQYPCEKLSELFKMVPENKKRLDTIRQGIK